MTTDDEILKRLFLRTILFLLLLLMMLLLLMLEIRLCLIIGETILARDCLGGKLGLGCGCGGLGGLR